MTMGERIKHRREELGLSQDEVATRCGYKSRSSINKIEKTRHLPIDKVEIIAKVLEVSPAYIMGWYEDEESTDTPVQSDLTPNEQLIIDRYRSLPEDKKASLLGYILAYTE